MDDLTLDALASRLPIGRVLREAGERTARSRDWWPLARLRDVRGDEPQMPAAVLLPSDTDEVVTMLRWANETATRVVPRGLGSGVCGGVVPPPGAVVLELSAMDRILEIDERSDTVTTQAGIRGDVLEAALGSKGLTMGHLPQSLALSSPGGWVAAWSAGQASPAYGAIEDRLLGLTAVLVDGTIVVIKPMPRATAGIDLRRAFLGSEGALGVITEVVLATSPLELETSWTAFRMPDFKACLEAARKVRQADIHPRFHRGWDEPDAIRSFGIPLGHDHGAVYLVGLAGSAPGLEGRQAAAAAIAGEAGGVGIDAAYGETWWSHRLGAVEAFDRVMGPARAQGSGVVLDTFEVTGRWADLPVIHAGVMRALGAASNEVGCHFSHVYGSGAALYFTFTLSASDDFEAEELYTETWDAALSACLDAGGSIAHHHGIGRSKADHLATELGPGAAELVTRIKAALDPQGLLNPGASISTLEPRSR